MSGTLLQELFGFVGRERVDVTPEHIYRLDEVGQAHVRLESPRSFGKLVAVNEGGQGGWRPGGDKDDIPRAPTRARGTIPLCFMRPLTFH